MGKSAIERHVILVETAGFLIVVCLLWVDELFDLPHNLFGATRTPVNWVESVFETLFVATLGTAVVYTSYHLLKRLRSLEGLLPICSFCKKVRNSGAWVPVEQYVAQHSRADFSHGLCPDCARKHYGWVSSSDDNQRNREAGDSRT